MKREDVVTLAIPQSDGQIKYRPAVLLKGAPPFGDWIICPISTQLRHEVPGVDMRAGGAHPGTAGMNLKAESIIRVTQLHIVPARAIRGVIGVMESRMFERLVRNLTQWLAS